VLKEVARFYGFPDRRIDEGFFLLRVFYQVVIECLLRFLLVESHQLVFVGLPETCMLFLKVVEELQEVEH
jgi:hypothetical protein